MMGPFLESNATRCRILCCGRGRWMGVVYVRLRPEERATIMLMRRDGQTARAIARLLGRAASTISRELRRQAEHGKLPYEATRAAARMQFTYRRQIFLSTVSHIQRP